MVSKRTLKAQTSKLKARVGLFGGTFNPIHIGHIKMAEAARKQFELDKIYFIPNGIPPHKPNKGLLPAKLRYKLVEKGVSKLNKGTRDKGQGTKNKPFGILDLEIKSKKPSYTLDTIKKLRGRKYSLLIPHPSLLFFLIGQDEFEKLHTWNKASELAKLVTFIVLPRSSRSSSSKTQNPKIKDLKWHLLKTKPIDISSTEIRKHLVF
ncbi:MAG: nicotinate (nicotinamide) nucleotide adenylyltransferase [Candidatus Melainabacteria bacterium]|nr:nicotinate (nicotinamide) nucleotide adenylyltransferase [Candidatus Melainabacteria bacterium]